MSSVDLTDSTTEAAEAGVTPVEMLDVVIVGAGLSGIGAAHYLQDRCPWASYAILEGRGAIGGTWDLFRYPGVRSDSDMFTLGYSFRPWESDRALAGGDSIRDYIGETARVEGIDRRIRYHHRVVRAEWSSVDAYWTLAVERTDTGETRQLRCRFLFSCTGYYRYDRGYLPDFPGMDRFEGTVVHPQFWPEDLDYSGRRVVVIGSGATAVTLVPSLTDRAAHVTMLQRSPSYIASLPGSNPLAGLLRRRLPRRWADHAIRWLNVLGMQFLYQLSRRRPAVVKRMIRKGIERELGTGFDIDTHFRPSYEPWDQRMCFVPDGDLFRAIKRGDASVVTDHIREFTPQGVLLESGQELQADIVVTATGLELLFMGGIEVLVDGAKVNPSDKVVYKGMMLEGVPNLAMAVGYTNASWTLKAELSCQYVCRLLQHMQRTGMRQCTPVNRDTPVSDQPLLGLASGYIQRSVHLFPKQGARFPWQVYQSYLRDYRALRADVEDGVMVFSNPAAPHRTTARPGPVAEAVPDAVPA